ncbi:MAG TPA: polymer-forming cytoskeletal protein [Bacteroidota bacterium]|nr:polymer-forming cytoskeletal protein [Bacteroidota bacterium]
MKTEPGNEAMSIITAGTICEGKLRSPGSIRIEGRVVGEIVAAQTVSIGSSGEVEGNVSAKTVTVGGKINGGVLAQEKLVFESKAVVRGDVRAAKLVIDEGALFDGKCIMSDSKGMPPQITSEVKPDLRRPDQK